MGKPPEKWILIDTKKFELHFHQDDWPIRTWPIGIGKEDTPTPTGNYRVYEMCENPQKLYHDQGIPVELYGTRSIDLSVQAFDFERWCWRCYSIHGTNDESKIGQRCSAGCIRMRNEDIEQLYELVKVGILVMII